MYSYRLAACIHRQFSHVNIYRKKSIIGPSLKAQAFSSLFFIQLSKQSNKVSTLVDCQCEIPVFLPSEISSIQYTHTNEKSKRLSLPPSSHAYPVKQHWDDTQKSNQDLHSLLETCQPTRKAKPTAAMRNIAIATQ